jgi:hypothetical protein
VWAWLSNGEGFSKGLSSALYFATWLSDVAASGISIRVRSTGLDFAAGLADITASGVSVGVGDCGGTDGCREDECRNGSGELHVGMKVVVVIEKVVVERVVLWFCIGNRFGLCMSV